MFEIHLTFEDVFKKHKAAYSWIRLPFPQLPTELELRRKREETSLALLLVTVLRQPGGEDSRRKRGGELCPGRQATPLSLAAQSNYFRRSHLDDMCPIHMPQICCPAALFPVWKHCMSNLLVFGWNRNLSRSHLKFRWPWEPGIDLEHHLVQVEDSSAVRTASFPQPKFSGSHWPHSLDSL